MSNYWTRFGGQPEPEAEPQRTPLRNVESLGKEPKEVIFVDRYEDVLALIECDMVNAVSFDGELPKSKDKSLDPLEPHWEVLKVAKRIVIAGAMDEGRRQALARRMGRHRCHLVTWPLDSANAEEALARHGTDGVWNLIERAQPFPIAGLHRPSAAALLALRSRPVPTTMTTGTRATDAVLHLPTEGRLIVLTGYPAGGKTSWARFLIVHTAEHHERRWAVFSPEMMPWEQFVADCAEVMYGKPFWPIPGVEAMTMDEIGRAGAWLEQRLTMMVCDAEDEAPSLDWLLGKAEDAVLRDGVTDILLDPWNEIEHTRSERMTETDYIGRSLQRIKAFIQRYGCNFWIIAHPAKPTGIKTGEAKPPPGPYDIASSAHWANKPDLGITIHSTEAGKAMMLLWKSRFRRFGVKNSSADMQYDELSGRYSDIIGDIAPPPSWRGYKEDD